ncbi:MAG: DHH family phosphoesterase [Christensenellales bacterium]
MNKIADVLIKNQDIALVIHVSPDGDAIGSSFGLAVALKKIGKSVRIYCDDPISDSYIALSPYGEIETALPQENWPACVVVLDCADAKRVGRCLELVEHSVVSCNLDHHGTNPANFTQYNYVDGEASSTSELVYRLLLLMEVQIDADIAFCLYSGIVFDTGNFSHSNTTSKALCVASELVSKGANPHSISVALFHTITRQKLFLFAKAISKMELYFKDRVAVVVVSLDDLAQYDAKSADCENIAEQLRDIDTVEAAFLLREMQKGKYKCSLRSKFYVDVAKVAGEFNGGGHKHAAGCVIFGTESSAKGEMLALLAKELRG